MKTFLFFVFFVSIFPIQSYAAKDPKADADLIPSRFQIMVFNGSARAEEKDGSIIDLYVKIGLHPRAQSSARMPSGMVFFLWDEQVKPRKLIKAVRAEPATDGRHIPVEFKALEQIVGTGGWKFSVSVDIRHEQAYVGLYRAIIASANVKALDRIRVSGDPSREIFTIKTK
ncbi:MAG TPA: hypothetical protein VGE35_00405 [Candidatus Paceibacterota bacterium]